MLTPTRLAKPSVTTMSTLRADTEAKRKINAGLSLANTKGTPAHPLAGLLIEVEGNIGSGKSTLTKRMRDKLNDKYPQFSQVFAETINNSFLEAFYSDLPKYAFAFQMYMLTTRLYQMEEGERLAHNEGKMVMLDRGAVGDTLFAMLNQKMGNITDQDFDIYKSVCRDRMPRTIADKVDMLLYLDVDPKECHRRVTTVRNNEAEEGIPLSYLDDVDKTYFHLMVDWLAGRKGGHHDMNIGRAPPVCVLRWDNFGEIEDAEEAMIALLHGHRKSPTVAFQLDCFSTETEIKDTLVIQTTQELEEAYNKLKSDNTLSATKLCINWQLEHSNEYRRVCMYYLSIQSHITFYGEVLDKDSDSEEDPMHPSTPSMSPQQPTLSPSSSSSTSSTPFSPESSISLSEFNTDDVLCCPSPMSTMSALDSSMELEK